MMLENVEAIHGVGRITPNLYLLQWLCLRTYDVFEFRPMVVPELGWWLCQVWS
jgi:hypothetical protein